MLVSIQLIVDNKDQCEYFILSLNNATSSRMLVQQRTETGGSKKP